LEYVRGGGDPLLQHPPAPGGDGGTPYCYTEHLSTQVTNTKYFTMEKDFHPNCDCGQPVMYHIDQIPVFENNVLIAMQPGNVWFHTRCEDCDYAVYVANSQEEEEDELPF
jgi:hypothetical protein